MNTRVIYINGIRIPHDMAKVAERRGANSDTAKITFQKVELDKLRVGAAGAAWVSMDEFYSGRLQAKFEYVKEVDDNGKMKNFDETEEEIMFVCARCPSELKR